uniref:SXP/RAL-2 family protein Ani s 5-like cation-binding domain-containing protein n=1 Tax=Strongyloides stercoralis TaxID=6248 RepID=A0A0K0EBB1_STRER
MHFIKYLAIFTILAVKFTLQDDSTSALESSSESGSNEVQPPNSGRQVAVPQKTKFFGKLKSTGEKFKKKMKEANEKMKNNLNSVKEKAKKAKDEAKDKFLNTKFGKKTNELTKKAGEKVKSLGTNLKSKLAKVL